VPWGNRRGTEIPEKQREEPIARIRENGSPNDMRPENQNCVYRREGTATNSINSFTARMPLMSPEDLPKKALFRAKPNRIVNHSDVCGLLAICLPKISLQ
jgi:hypothetical protein